MHYLPKPLSIQFELSNVCNALCSSCNRNTIDWSILKPMVDRGEHVDITNLPMKVREEVGSPQYLTKEIFTNIFSGAPSVREIYFCGTIDDPLAHKDLIGITKHVFDIRPDMHLGAHTNGSIRNPDYFKRWAEALKGKDHFIWFSIDGLEDTNHLYRKNCQWDKIMANAKAFIEAGGVAGWQYLIFPWNEHQVDEAKALADKLGFKKFRSRVNKSPLLNDLSNHVKQERSRLNRIRRHGVDFNDEVVLKDPIYCAWQKEVQQYHVSYDGRLWPCCYMNSTKTQRSEMLNERIDGNYGSDWNNLYKNSWNDVIAHEFYSNDLVSSWDSKSHGSKPGDRIYRCTEVCTKKVAFKATNFSENTDFKTGKVIVQEANNEIARLRAKEWKQGKRDY